MNFLLHVLPLLALVFDVIKFVWERRSSSQKDLQDHQQRPDERTVSKTDEHDIRPREP